MNFLKFLLSITTIVYISSNKNNDEVQIRGPKQYVTCGSTLRLRNLLTGY